MSDTTADTGPKGPLYKFPPPDDSLATESADEAFRAWVTYGKKHDMLLRLLRNGGHVAEWQEPVKGGGDDEDVPGHWRFQCADDREDAGDQRRMVFHVTAYDGAGFERDCDGEGCPCGGDGLRGTS